MAFCITNITCPSINDPKPNRAATIVPHIYPAPEIKDRTTPDNTFETVDFTPINSLSAVPEPARKAPSAPGPKKSKAWNLTDKTAVTEERRDTSPGGHKTNGTSMSEFINVKDNRHPRPMTPVHVPIETRHPDSTHKTTSVFSNLSDNESLEKSDAPANRAATPYRNLRSRSVSKARCPSSSPVRRSPRLEERERTKESLRSSSGLPALSRKKRLIKPDGTAIRAPKSAISFGTDQRQLYSYPASKDFFNAMYSDETVFLSAGDGPTDSLLLADVSFGKLMPDDILARFRVQSLVEKDPWDQSLVSSVRKNPTPGWEFRKFLSLQKGVSDFQSLVEELNGISPVQTVDPADN
ncbi:hypothetical protein CKK34_5745 [Yarrowia sp. E02]|nr:hypothetical protein CKK34_5745 [Yarrowia sp. E02]